MNLRFVRLGEREREPVSLSIDGRQVQALAGDTLLVALLTHVADDARSAGSARGCAVTAPRIVIVGAGPAARAHIKYVCQGVLA